MSLLGNVLRVGATALATVYGGPAAGAAVGAMVAKKPAAPASYATSLTASMPGIGVLGMGALPAIGTAAGVAVRYAGAAARGAAALCRKHIQWCTTVGGTAAVAAMIESGQLPMPRRRRGRGISSGNLRAYRRVHNLLAGFCAPKARIKRICN